MDKKFTIEIGGYAIDIILNALQDRPYKEVAGIIAEIYGQVEKQQAPTEGEKADGK